jgi:hypothetical protein
MMALLSHPVHVLLLYRCAQLLSWQLYCKCLRINCLFPQSFVITWHKETGAVNPENQQQSPWTQRGTEEGGQNDFGQLHPPDVTPFLVGAWAAT